MRAILLAGGMGLLVTLLVTPLAIRVLIAKHYGQLIRDDGPTSHHTKRGTPQMGGLVIMISVLAAYAFAMLVTQTEPSTSALLLLFLYVGLGVVGFMDDYIKISKQRSLGLRSKTKMAGQTVVALTFAILALNFPDDGGVTPMSRSLSFIRDFSWELPAALVVIWVLVMIAGTSNAVNLTDGLDGLATGSSGMVFGAYVFVNLWQYNQSCSAADAVSRCYDVRDPLDLAVVAAALTGACFGFLWWNASPAQIFMGDTGSLSLGGAIAGFAVMTQTELLLPIIGGLFVVQAVSVMLQVGWFKLSGGKRLFRMAPLHHHFELGGWAEITVVIRFWIVCVLCVSLGLGIFYAEWVAGA